MTARQQLLAMVATAALLALPVLAIAQPSAPPHPAPAGTATDGAAPARIPPGASAHNLAVDAATLRQGRRASRIVGATVYNDAGETVGQVDDLLIPRVSGPPVVIISVGGFLGIGAKLVAVPYDSLRFGNDRWSLPGATKESLGALPGFSYEVAPPAKG